MVRYNGLVWSNIAVPALLPSYIDDPWCQRSAVRCHNIFFTSNATLSSISEEISPSSLTITLLTLEYSDDNYFTIVRLVTLLMMMVNHQEEAPWSRRTLMMMMMLQLEINKYKYCRRLSDTCQHVTAQTKLFLLHIVWGNVQQYIL